MRAVLLGLILTVSVAGSAMADSWVAGHYTRSGRWVEGHWRRDRPPSLRPTQRSSYEAGPNSGPRASSYKPPRQSRYPSSYRRKR